MWRWTDADFEAFRSVAAEVMKQRQALHNDMRTPRMVRINKTYLEALLQDDKFLANPGDDRYMGLIYGLPTYLDDGPGIRVIPEDWQGAGTGETRPGAAKVGR